MGKVIDVRFYDSQSAEDLYMTTDGSRRIYVRQPANVDNLVFWLTSSKWQGGYEASAPIRAGITMRVVDQEKKVLFEETLREDSWNGGTSAEKKGPFSREALDSYLSGCEIVQGLKSHEEWRDCLLRDKADFNNADYDDNWLYWDTESVSKKVLDKFQDGLGETCYLMSEQMRHKTSGREWTVFEIVDDSKACVLSLCGYQFEDERVATMDKLKKGEPVTLWWSDPDWSKTAPCYASCEYSGKTRDGKLKFVSDTYGWEYLVDVKNNKVITPHGKECELDNSSGWADRLFADSKKRVPLGDAIKTAKGQRKPEGERKGQSGLER